MEMQVTKATCRGSDNGGSGGIGGSGSSGCSGDSGCGGGDSSSDGGGCGGNSGGGSSGNQLHKTFESFDKMTSLFSPCLIVYGPLFFLPILSGLKTDYLALKNYHLDYGLMLYK